ncbi:signal peptidase II [Oleiagrimonas sp. C23AA]|uniref:signal peptidase II n=1 Tax=Oleiagrimonas sp. C23AA TaxID=2719047 RepID=UPI001421EAFB|nr:signal peptidase II [Oleiagrimonas sp. C23AA]NII09157.1 lipoprotein signal peptidase [Oleiagrimonas sp. C23AA]
MSVKPNALVWLWLAVAVIVADQASKAWVLSVMQPGEVHAFIPHVLYGTLAFNTGAAFSFLADGSGWQRWFFVALALGVSAVLAVWLSRTPRRDWRTAVPLALVVGGALGNLIDRLHAGRVTDFILVYIGDYAWPAFNVADSAICVGAVALVVFSLFGAKPKNGV